MNSGRRHPVLEAAVFAAALLLAAFLGRELWRRRAPPSAAPSAGAAAGAPELPAPSAAVSRTERAVTSVPPIKLTRIGRRKKSAAVPAPRP